MASSGANYKLRCDFCSVGYKAVDGACLKSDNTTNSCPAHCNACAFQSQSYTMSCSECSKNYTLIYNYDQTS